MLLALTCASAICFAPELNIYKPSRQEKKVEAQWPAPTTMQRFVSSQDIVVSTGMPLRYLTESEQRVLDRALFKSVKIVKQGILGK